jgi:1,4-dihydroxy-2-naphthoyl-CoA hydrolase
MLFASKNINIHDLNALLKGTLSEAIGMEVTEIGDQHLKMKMPVDRRTIQPFGILDGGACMALAESVASIAGNILVSPEKRCVGLEINGNHLRPVSEGWVHATAKPIHIGKSTHIWSIEIVDDSGTLICISRMTLAVLESKKNG